MVKGNEDDDVWEVKGIMKSKREAVSGVSSAALDDTQCGVLWALSGRTLGCGDGSPH